MLYTIAKDYFSLVVASLLVVDDTRCWRGRQSLNNLCQRYRSLDNTGESTRRRRQPFSLLLLMIVILLLMLFCSHLCRDIVSWLLSSRRRISGFMTAVSVAAAPARVRALLCVTSSSTDRRVGEQASKDSPRRRVLLRSLLWSYFCHLQRLVLQFLLLIVVRLRGTRLVTRLGQLHWPQSTTIGMRAVKYLYI